MLGTWGSVPPKLVDAEDKCDGKIQFVTVKNTYNGDVSFSLCLTSAKNYRLFVEDPKHKVAKLFPWGKDIQGKVIRLNKGEDVPMRIVADPKCEKVTPCRYVLKCTIINRDKRLSNEEWKVQSCKRDQSYGPYHVHIKEKLPEDDIFPDSNKEKEGEDKDTKVAKVDTKDTKDTKDAKDDKDDKERSRSTRSRSRSGGRRKDRSRSRSGGRRKDSRRRSTKSRSRSRGRRYR